MQAIKYITDRSIVDNKVETKSNMLTLLIRAASGVIGYGSNALKTIIVNGLVLLTQIVSYLYVLWNDNSVLYKYNIYTLYIMII